MLKNGSRSLAWLFALSLVAVACGDDDDSDGATGGSTSTGGKATGGAKSTGGSQSTGGSKATGGTTSGGTSGKGGTTSTGGSVTSGGTGGTSTGGADAGGAAGSGAEGGTPEGGTSMGGGGGVVEGGSAGAPTGGTAGAETGGTAGGDSVDGGAGGSGGEPAVQLPIVNAGFETWDDNVIPGWTKAGTDLDGADKKWSANEAHTGNYYLNFWKGTAYETTVSQIVSSVPNGNYSLSIWQLGGAYTEQYVFARGYNSADTAAKLTANTSPSTPWVQIIISPIPVTSGQIEIGVYSKGVADAWSHFDDVTLTKLP